MKSDLINEVKRQLIVQTSLSPVLSSLRVPDMNADLSSHDSNDEIMIKSMFKARDIYNIKVQMRRDALGSWTWIQALIRQLQEED